MSLDIICTMVDADNAPARGSVVFRQLDTGNRTEASIVIESGSTGELSDDGIYRLTERVLGLPEKVWVVDVVSANWANPLVAYEDLPTAYGYDCATAAGRPYGAAVVHTAGCDCQVIGDRLTANEAAIAAIPAPYNPTTVLARLTTDEQNLAAALLRVTSQEELTNDLLKDTPSVYASASAYSPGDVVSYQGGLYLNVGASTGVEPGTDPDKWASMAIPDILALLDLLKTAEAADKACCAANAQKLHMAENAAEAKRLVKEAVWHVDAGDLLADESGLRDLSGGGNDLIFTPGSEPGVLPHDGEDYVHVPAVASNGVQIVSPVGTVWTATKTDGTTVTGTTAADPWVFAEAGDWKRIESDNGDVILDPSQANADQTLIANTGTAGGDWTINRADTGLKTVVVDRPKLLFGGAESSTSSNPLPTMNGTKGITAIVALNRYGNYTNITSIIDTAYANSGAPGINIQEISTYIMRARVRSDANALKTKDYTAKRTGKVVAVERVTDTTLEMMVNGTVQSACALTPGAVYTHRAPVGIGCNSRGSWQWTGEISSVAVFARALTDDEIALVSAEIQTTHPEFVVLDADGNAHIPGSVTADGILYAAGVGSPEGRVAAGVGSEYVDRSADPGAGGTGPIRWTKATGSGNTGWERIYSVTDLKAVTAAAADFAAYKTAIQGL